MNKNFSCVIFYTVALQCTVCLVGVNALRGYGINPIRNLRPIDLVIVTHCKAMHTEVNTRTLAGSFNKNLHTTSHGSPANQGLEFVF